VIRLSELLKHAVARAAGWERRPLTPAQSRIAAVVLDEIATAPEEDLHLPMPRDPRLQRIARAIAEGHADKRRMADWADWAGLAPRTLSRRFVVETGLTFSAWRQRMMLLRSLEMLAAGRSVTTAAFDLGYETVSAFIAAFRAHFGETPARRADPSRRFHSSDFARRTRVSVLWSRSIRSPFFSGRRVRMPSSRVSV
jgi:AraC-like DNA-binding protein